MEKIKLNWKIIKLEAGYTEINEVSWIKEMFDVGIWAVLGELLYQTSFYTSVVNTLRITSRECDESRPLTKKNIEKHHHKKHKNTTTKTPLT